MDDSLICDGRGWYRTYRQLDEWEWYKTPHMVHIFIHLLNKANYKDNQWEGITVKRGQLVTSLEKLSEQTGKSIQSVRTCINRLKSTGEITDKSTNKFRLITIVKYDSYQQGDEHANKQNNNQTNKQATSKQQATNNNEEVKKERIEIRSSPNGNCPHTQVIELYHKYLPTMPMVKTWSTKRKAYLNARWKQAPEQSLEWWENFFKYISGIKFLTEPGKMGWRCDLEWIITESNFIKIREGKYE